MSLNRVCLVGRLTRDPESKFTPTGKQVASLSIAVNRFTKKEDGSGYESDFFNLTAWGKTAEFAQNYLTKGRLVSIDGRLQQRSWVDQATGTKRFAVDIVAEHIEGLDKKPDTTGEPSGPTPSETPAPAQHEELDESDPFADSE